MENVTCKKCGLIDDYSVTEKSGHKMAYCNGCNSFIKNIAHQPPYFYFGKYKGTRIDECWDIDYLGWCMKNNVLKGRHKEVGQLRYVELVRKEQEGKNL
jgi:uncharacterized protein (DUF3820 family)